MDPRGGRRARRAGLQIQRNSEVISTQLADGLAERGVVRRSRPGDRRAPRARRTPPARARSSGAVEVHRPARRLPHRRHALYVPDEVQVRLPLQTLTWIDADRTAVFPHTLIVTGVGAEVTFIDRYASPDLPMRRCRRGRRDRRRSGQPDPLRRPPGVRRRRDPPRGAARPPRPGRLGPFARRRVRCATRACRGRDRARGRRVLERDARGVLRRRRAAHRPPVDPGSRGVPDLERPLYKGAMRDASNAIYTARS